MPSRLHEALDWLYRAEQARGVAGQLTDPGARRAVLELADIFDRLARAAASRAVLRRRELARRRPKGNPRFRRWVARSKGGDRWEETSLAQHRGSLTPEERARVIEVQDLLIERFVEFREATAGGWQDRAKELETEIECLLREKEEIERWAVVGSA
jgi:hypothetical protein